MVIRLKLNWSTQSSAKKANQDWRYSRKVFLTHLGQAHEAPEAGEIFRQVDLAATLRKLVETEQQALGAGKNRKEAIYAAYERFYRGDIAREFASSVKEEGGLISQQDLANWKVKIEEPVKTTYKGVEVYKLTDWTQGPAMLQALNILENFDLREMGYNSARYVHTIYQAMNLAFADQTFTTAIQPFHRTSRLLGCFPKSTRNSEPLRFALIATIQTSHRAIRIPSKAAQTLTGRCWKNGIFGRRLTRIHLRAEVRTPCNPWTRRRGMLTMISYDHSTPGPLQLRQPTKKAGSSR